MKQFRNILMRIGTAAVLTAGTVISQSPVIAAEAEETVSVACVHDNVRIREGKSKDSNTVAVLPKDSLCRVYTRKGEDDTTWAYVKSGAYQGYVFNECLDYSESTLGDITYTNGVVFLRDTDVYTKPDDSSDVLVERKVGATEEIVPIGADITYNGYYQVLVSLSTSTIRAGWVKADDVVSDMIYPDAESYDDFIAQLKMTKKELQEATQKAKEKAQEDSTSLSGSSSDSGTLSDNIIQNASNARSNVSSMLESSVYTVSAMSSSSSSDDSSDTSTQESSSNDSSSSSWTGSKLTAYKGVNYGPSGKETYYNLPMNGVISIMRGMGNTDKYWVRSDGCKMLGDYIMVAADLSKHPRGSIIQTSLGEAIVADTGDFVKNGSGVSVDIATAW